MYDILPLAYLGGWYNMFLIPFINGGKVVLDRPFGTKNLYSFWENVKKYQVNALWFNPMMLSMLLQVGADDLNSVIEYNRGINWALVGMAPLSTGLKKKFEENFKLNIYENYGLSETFFLVSDSKEIQLPKGAVGKVLDGVEIIIDGEGEGEVLVNSPYMFEAYFEDRDLTNQVKKGSYFRTGDIGKLKDGFLYIVGRLKDIIIKGGINISPKEVQDSINRLEGVQDSCVFGVNHQHYGESLVAAVVLAKDSHLNAKEIKRALKSHIASLKIPDKIKVLDELPLNSSGKVDLVGLKGLFLNE
jgi:long-chain acyl-CoA synthetase